ncbi:MAG TPA: hypothetical protein VFS94_04310 [Gemmatimonadales bacterium]|nr:hypothetical protein [Gemmatimonadales bacterium]
MTSPRPIIDRVHDRVAAAAASIAGPAARSRSRRKPVPFATESPREVRAMKLVFREMGRTQRATRQERGQEPSPAVREAALAFRRSPSMPALVQVASSLDEVGLLAW